MRKIKTAIELAVITCVSAFASSQTGPNVHQTATKSSCVNIVALSGAKVDCSNLIPAQKKALAEIPSILKMTFENQNYLDAIMKKLEEMSQAPTQPSAQIEQHGEANGAIGGTLTQGQRSIAQIGGAGNTAVIGKEEWAIAADQQIKLRDALEALHGRVRFDEWAMEPDSHIHAERLAWPFHEAGWTIVYSASTVLSISPLPAVLDYCRDRSDFHGISRAGGPTQLTWMPVIRPEPRNSARGRAGPRPRRCCENNNGKTIQEERQRSYALPVILANHQRRPTKRKRQS
jgi:hypothetical protein